MRHLFQAALASAALALAMTPAFSANGADYRSGELKISAPGVSRSGELKVGSTLTKRPSGNPDAAVYPETEGTLSTAGKNRQSASSASHEGEDGVRIRENASARPSGKVDDPRKRLLNMEGIQAGSSTKENARNLRCRVIGEAGSTIAFQQGLRWRYSQLENACRRRSNELDRMFDFRPLLIDGRVLPPVIRWAGRSMSLHDESSATAVDATYRIIQPARIVSTAPIWEAYLLKDFDAFDGTLEVMPRTSDEKTSWRLGVEKGWDEGVAHADEVFDMNMARLVSDYRGMLRFKMLAKAGMLSIPVLAEGRLGVRVGDRTLDVNQTVFRITAPAGFRGSQHWTPGTSGKPE